MSKSLKKKLLKNAEIAKKKLDKGGSAAPAAPAKASLSKSGCAATLARAALMDSMQARYVRR